MESQTVTAESVVAALAALGRPASSDRPLTDRDLPALLGALLAVVETEIMEHGGAPDAQARVIDGQTVQTGANDDSTHLSVLTALRLGRTAAQLRGPAGPARSLMTDLAAEAARAASAAMTLHLTTTDPDSYDWSERALHTQLVTLEDSVNAVIQRYSALAQAFAIHLAA
jgi:hypothetical protein